MELSIIAAVVIALVVGAGVTFLFMKNKTSADPHSFKDEIRDLKDYIDAKFRRQEQIVQAPAPVETVQVKAENVEVFGERSDAPTSGAKAIDNDDILGIKN